MILFWTQNAVYRPRPTTGNLFFLLGWNIDVFWECALTNTFMLIRHFSQQLNSGYVFNGCVFIRPKRLKTKNTAKNWQKDEKNIEMCQ